MTRPYRLTPLIRRFEDRATGTVRYCIDRGEIQLLGPWYDTREQAETALAVTNTHARTLGQRCPPRTRRVS